jgi:hypothetical protein
MGHYSHSFMTKNSQKLLKIFIFGNVYLHILHTNMFYWSMSSVKLYYDTTQGAPNTHDPIYLLYGPL